MPLVEEAVSAFAVYSGHSGQLSKGQRRRRRMKEKKNLTSINNQIEPIVPKKKKEINVGSKRICQRKTKRQKIRNNDADTLKEIQEAADLQSFAEVKDNSEGCSKSNIKESEINNPEGLIESSKQQKVSKSVKGNLLKSSKLKTNGIKNKLKTQKKVIKKAKLKKVRNSKLTVPLLNIEKTNVKDVIPAEFLKVKNAKKEIKPTLISTIAKRKLEIAEEAESVDNLSTRDRLVYYNKFINQMKSSTEIGKDLFKQIIAPANLDEFFKVYWERRPLYVSSNCPTKFSKLMSTELIDNVLRQKVIMFGKHIDVTSYRNGERETHNLEGRALPHVVWDLYYHKCSVRLLYPQAVFPNILMMNTTLQEFFGCFVGSNSYLTPPNSQGFAPHYDDIEAFILQIEGEKHWKIYSPRNKSGILPRYSSKNFKQDDLSRPILEVTLKPGDVLYFPRGYIHQASTGTSHSLHLTVSVYQKNSWVDLLEKLLPLALSRAAQCNVNFRRGLPLNFINHAGIAKKSIVNKRALLKCVKKKIMALMDYIDLDGAVDLMGVEYVKDALPPVLSLDQASRTTFGNGLRMETNGNLKGSVLFSGDTKVRFLTSLCYRLAKEKIPSEEGNREVEEYKLYYTIDNSYRYHGMDPQFLVIPKEYVRAIKLLSINYPAFTFVDQLPLPTLDDKARLVGDLWDRGILMTEEPLEEESLVEHESDDDDGSRSSTSEENDAMNIGDDNEENSDPMDSEQRGNNDNDVMVLENDKQEKSRSMNDEREGNNHNEDDKQDNDDDDDDDEGKREYDDDVNDIEQFVSGDLESEDDDNDEYLELVAISSEDDENEEGEDDDDDGDVDEEEEEAGGDHDDDGDDDDHELENNPLF